MAEINDLKIIDDNNISRFPEGQTAASVNNAARALEGLIARWNKDTNASVSASGTGDIISVSANQTLTAYYDGLVIAFAGAATCTGGGVTLNVDALGAKSLLKFGSAALSASDIVSGKKVIAIYDGTNFQVVSSMTDTVASTAAATSAAAALVSQNAAAADAVLTNADVVSTAASATNAATSETNAAASEANSATSATASAASATASAASAASNLFSKLSTKATADSPYAVVANTDDGTMFSCSMDGNITMTLPDISVALEGERYGILRVGAANVLTLARTGTDTIDGVAGSYTVNAIDGEFLILCADQASPNNWLVIPWSQAIADETTLAKTGSTIAIKASGVGTSQIADNAITTDKVAGTVNAQVGTTYTLALTDAFKTVTASNAAAVTVTVPANATVAFAAGDRIDIVGIGIGLVTVTAAAGVTMNGIVAGSGAFSSQYSAASLVKTSTDTWLLLGDHGGVA